MYPLSTDELIAQKRAEIAAKMAAMTGKKPTFSTGPLSAAPIAKPGPASTMFIAPQPLATAAATEELARRVAEAKKRVADAQKAMSVKDNPYLVSRYDVRPYFF